MPQRLSPNAVETFVALRERAGRALRRRMCSVRAEFWRGCRWKRRVQRLVIAAIASSTLSDSSIDRNHSRGYK